MPDSSRSIRRDARRDSNPGSPGAACGGETRYGDPLMGTTHNAHTACFWPHHESSVLNFQTRMDLAAAIRRGRGDFDFDLNNYSSSQ